ncbi:hypothetical protein OU787_02995 [Kitasatospora sp. YST-16]|uniref:hypothetical protein n=1 Tax=Kitasatospora sp. YST-16 TaxID=2998080 RepID=UPI002284922B|nr:hypothetical protein [Kitasatospora sp. YST-16]WAL70554.1 hypothetical protein OU787_02995 [Kitasatospora sp. YST-16]WNW36594.1 hypothetical protein RKE32_02990 [Streptomyces sp. Li-HN-5-13]
MVGEPGGTGRALEIGAAVRAELGRTDWSGTACRCGGTAGHLVPLFEALLEVEEPGRLRMTPLVPHLVDRDGPAACAVPAVRVMLAALAGGVPGMARTVFLDALADLARFSAEPGPSESGPSESGASGSGPSESGASGPAASGSGRAVHAECRELARRDLGSILREGLAGTPGDAARAAAVCEAYWPGDADAADAWVRLAERAGL